ncbi:hypothetical protein MD484_g7276, partial [Candolleomyces efflorescens]
MFSRFARLPLRRCLHTASTASKPAPRFSRGAKVVLGTSAAAAAYLSWNLASQRNTVYMDSPAKPPASKSHPPKSQTSPTPSEQSNSLSSAAEPTPESSNDAKVTEGGEDVSEGEAPPQNKGAYDPETGEINWDCPCLGGMAHGPCGEQFKEAFSCFIFSEEEPKGINCVEAFKKMQDCFREHPDVYADEIMSDDDDEPATTIPADETVPNGETPRQVGEEAVAEIPALSETHSEHQAEASPSTSH